MVKKIIILNDIPDPKDMSTEELEEVKTALRELSIISLRGLSRAVASRDPESDHTAYQRRLNLVYEIFEERKREQERIEGKNR